MQFTSQTRKPCYEVQVLYQQKRQFSQWIQLLSLTLAKLHPCIKIKSVLNVKVIEQQKARFLFQNCEKKAQGILAVTTNRFLFLVGDDCVEICGFF